MPKFVYSGEDGRLFPALPLEVDAEGAPTVVAPFTLNNGDIVETAVNPDEAFFSPSSGKKAAVEPDPVRFAHGPAEPPAPAVEAAVSTAPTATQAPPAAASAASPTPDAGSSTPAA